MSIILDQNGASILDDVGSPIDDGASAPVIPPAPPSAGNYLITIDAVVDFDAGPWRPTTRTKAPAVKKESSYARRMREKDWY